MTGVGWVSLAIGLVWSTVVFAGGVLSGGTRFGASAPRPLAQLRTVQGA